MATPPQILQEQTNKTTMLSNASIEDLEEYTINACEILESKAQFATAKIIEELIDQEIKDRIIIEKLNSLYKQFPEYGEYKL